MKFVWGSLSFEVSEIEVVALCFALVAAAISIFPALVKHRLSEKGYGPPKNRRG